MKMVIAIIPHHKLDEVQVELEKVDVTRMTLMDVRGFGRQKGHKEIFRGQEVQVKFVNKLMIMIACNDDFVKPTTDTIQKVCFSGKPGDGKVFVLPLEEVFRISTREMGGAAI
ncbi:MAG: P-II family nitrogen regulator [Leptonema illini]|jgi:nitrogen regulatory protein PII|uniref:Nitrogen regulatory protein P-II n=2 Tax=Leptonema illini TaxID=183 RepID=H2CLF6_9LEPT|nr:P-II family nitrogen regulator [Leptonema illini]EHQ04567.1 nitrogen regulatory protein P-II [Leptonema illini DSM 21528]KAB2932725.1 MAG: P-II family nitrogen regulator [Leptonema illini]PKL33017.1 MAG: P-II family nitrogen regulator [Spirochaetae bacterium HGW-Spirochaetae-10]